MSDTQAGRPTLFTPELGNAICVLISEGMSLRKIEKLPNMPSKRAMLYWLAAAMNDKENKVESELVTFLHQYTRAREMQADVLAEECIDIADDSTFDSMEENGKLSVNFEHIQRDKLRVDSRKWYVGKLNPKKYSERIFAENKNENDNKNINLDLNQAADLPDDKIQKLMEVLKG